MVCYRPEPFSKVTGRIWMSRRLFRKAVRQGRSEVHDATNKERHDCACRRDGEPAVTEDETSPSYPPTLCLPRQALFPWRYVEHAREARTPLAAFFNSLPS